VNAVPAILTLLSLALTLWQWLAGRRFPLHRRESETSFAPAVTLLKPLKGCDAGTAACLRSWLQQDYPGATQILFGVVCRDDPVCAVVETLLREFPGSDARLVVCPERLGANAKVAKLVQLERLARHEIVVVSDADVFVPADFLRQAVLPLRDETVGLVSCFYRLAAPATAALRWEAVAVNADFWSMVLQSRDLAPLDFALGAAMATRRRQLAEIGGFPAIADCLADDYQLGHRIARLGYRLEICPVVVECRSAPMSWGEVWRHQLRWARTIRVCKPGSYFLSGLGNATLWPLLWLAVRPSCLTAMVLCLCLLARIFTARHLQRKLNQSTAGDRDWWLAPVKDLLQTALWLGAFAGNTVDWRGERYRLFRDGTLRKTDR
jgi:ceramide glucosyltransferase